ncbi:hypothetical protein F5880DRAFT_1512409, partial [Lentinula raphanica]
IATGSDDDEHASELALEDFATSDVSIDLMRNLVENLKAAEEAGEQIEVGLRVEKGLSALERKLVNATVTDNVASAPIAAYKRDTTLHFMELLKSINDDVHLAQSTWDVEVEERVRLMSVACVSIEEDRNSFLHLASETRQLLAWVDSFTGFHKHAFTSLETAHDIPLVKWIPRNAELLHRLIFESPRISERMLENPLLKKALMLQIAGAPTPDQIRSLEAAYSVGAQNKPKPQPDGVQPFLLPKRQEMRRVLTAASKLDCFLRLMPLGQHFSTSTTAYDTTTQSVSTLYPSLTPDLPQEKNSSTEHLDVEEHTLDFSFDASFEDLRSKFHSYKEKKMQMVLKAIGQFRDDGEMLASEIGRTHKHLQARLQYHRSHLDSLNDSADKVITQVNHTLDNLRGKPSSEADRSDLLDFGQARTTEYIEELWIIVLRLLPVQGAVIGRNRLFDELHRFDLDMKTFSEIESVSYTEQSPEAGLPGVDSFSEIELPESPPSALQTLAEELACADEACFSSFEDITTSIRNTTAAEEASMNSSILALPSGRASLYQDSTPVSCEAVAVKHTVRLCGIIFSWVASFACLFRAHLASIAPFIAPEFGLLLSR